MPFSPYRLKVLSTSSQRAKKTCSQNGNSQTFHQILVLGESLARNPRDRKEIPHGSLFDRNCGHDLAAAVVERRKHDSLRPLVCIRGAGDRLSALDSVPQALTKRRGVGETE